jgi:hypothetical protein
MGSRRIVTGSVAAVLLLAGCGHASAKPRAAATAAETCHDTAEPYGAAPDGFAYERADEATREQTVKSLGLDESGGRVDMRVARRGGVALGSLVGVPSEAPADYVATVVSRAKTSGAQVADGTGFEVITLPNGSSVALGARGCRAVFITSQDPNGVRYLASAIFGG